tara:strand:- start:37684 stop:38433 length:750 start_codon:yes stop_codon:yes gene_type:complete
MSNKLIEAFSRLIKTSDELKKRVSSLEENTPSVINGVNGQDGKTPNVDAIIEAVVERIPEPETLDTQVIVADVLSRLPAPRDGRDAEQVNVSDLAAILLPKIPKPKNGVDGQDGLSVVGEIGAQGDKGLDGKDGIQGEKGLDGKDGIDGVSVTDVKLKNNELYVYLDGKKKKAGSITMPKPSSFFPGSSGKSGGSTQIIAGGGDGFVQWYIKSTETVTIPSCKEMAVHGEFVLDGELIIEENARLRLES